MRNKKGDLASRRGKNDVNEDNDEEEELWCHKLRIKVSNLKVYIKLILLQTLFPVCG